MDFDIFTFLFIPISAFYGLGKGFMNDGQPLYDLTFYFKPAYHYASYILNSVS